MKHFRAPEQPIVHGIMPQPAAWHDQHPEVGMVRPGGEDRLGHRRLRDIGKLGGITRRDLAATSARAIDVRKLQEPRTQPRPPASRAACNPPMEIKNLSLVVALFTICFPDAV